jgi:hypothetical protein
VVVAVFSGAEWRRGRRARAPRLASFFDVKQPKLATFKHDSFFAVNADRNGIRFRVFHGVARSIG